MSIGFRAVAAFFCLKNLLRGCITSMAKIVNNLEGLPPETLNLAERFL